MFVFGLPVVNIGSRQNGRERGDNVIDVKNNEFEILSALSNLIKGNRSANPHIFMVQETQVNRFENHRRNRLSKEKIFRLV